MSEGCNANNAVIAKTTQVITEAVNKNNKRKKFMIPTRSELIMTKVAP